MDARENLTQGAAEQIVTLQLKKTELDQLCELLNEVAEDFKWHCETDAIRDFFEDKLCDKTTSLIYYDIIENERREPHFKKFWQADYVQQQGEAVKAIQRAKELLTA
jgi:hypothetical protein